MEVEGGQFAREQGAGGKWEMMQVRGVNVIEMHQVSA